MAPSIFKPFGKLFLFTFSVLGIACFSLPAFAQQNVVAGCNANVWKAMTAKADAQVAYDVAVTRQMINKPDSVLTLTCFDQAAGVSATAGGAIFSGDFAAPLSGVMPVLAGGYTCTQIGDLWNTIVNGGINTGAPYATFDMLVNGDNMPVPQNDFGVGWSVAQQQQIFTNLKNAVAALSPPQQQQQPMDFSQAKSSCDVLKIANILQNCPQSGP